MKAAPTVAAVLLLALTSVPTSAARADDPPGYELALDERDPAEARFTLRLPSGPEQRLVVERGTEQAVAAPPRCGAQPLRQVAAGAWIKPADCRAVAWSARLADHDTLGIDATRPASAWSAGHRLWILTNALPWLRAERQPRVPARIVARLADGASLSQRYDVALMSGAPLYFVVAAGRALRYAEPGFEIRVHGAAPRFAGADELQQAVARTWLEWRRDILPPGANPVERLDVAWVRPPVGAEPGFFASTGSDAILMQHVPDPADPRPEVKLRASVMLIGAHEGFHALLGAFGEARPAWVGESWASYFAYRAARRHLSDDSLAVAGELVATPVTRSILDGQRSWDAGDSSAALVFYSKGARFWAAIEGVLDGPGNATGRLAALIQASEGMRGLDWRSVDAVAAWFDRHSRGKAGPIARCYLGDAACAEAAFQAATPP